MALSFPLSSTVPTPEHRIPEVVRHTAVYHPSVWGDYFLKYSEDTKVDAWAKRVEELKEEVKRIMSEAKGSVQELQLIDDLQRLEVAYHFEKEIDEALHRICGVYATVDYDDLHAVALRFRLLRQEGYNVSSDVFTKFKDDQGHFKASLTSDVKGMLSLYEAAYLSTHGEDILDEAIVFTTGHLKSLMAHLDHPLATQVHHALELPLRKRIQRLEARYYISVYDDDVAPRDVLLELAKLDFNVVQSLHRKEIKEISRWWKDIDVARKLPYARDRIVEVYFWTLSVYFEPQYSRGRIVMTKMIGLFSIMDDTYDAYGTLEELEPFTEAIERWDAEAMDQMPEFMKVCFQALLETVLKIEGLLTQEERSYRIPYLKEVVKELARAYLVEAQWFNSGYVPTLKEYLRIALLTSGYPALTLVSFVGMGEIATKEAFEWTRNEPKLIRAASFISRIVDDIQSGKFEQTRGHVASAVQCYMNENGASEQEARDKFREMITMAWKDINQECLRPTSIPMPLLMRVINLTNVIETLYMHEDGYTNSSGATKVKITTVLIKPISV
ncbi:(-)-germacrene D synthase-like isoform X2 [Magnolia sinica]|uniref:(-)-germacrene D synthase-like isoform X2 n=1 Tax=Magnolia sinica TaxID=86752 RepID=UPI0026581678|nr:(-)-germacrene D synthase-like isoform X2 [Magnolia sinica]